MISWFSRKQSIVALSTAEAEYIVACSGSCEAIWLRKMMSGLFNLELDTTVILCDNQSCIKMTENPVFHDRLLPPKLYLVVFYQVSLVNRTGLTCSDFKRPLEVLLGSAC